MLIELLLMIAIGSLIGWITNYFAIKMLFRPYKEINILGFKIQGLIPKRRKEMAHSIAETINEELISIKDITHMINSMEVEMEIDKIVEKIVEDKLKGEILSKVPMASLFINESLIAKIKGYIKDVIEENKAEFVQIIVEKLEEEVDFREIVAEKIENFSLEEVEKLTFKIAKTELKHIEVIGAILGAVIGSVQFLITYFI